MVSKLKGVSPLMKHRRSGAIVHGAPKAPHGSAKRCPPPKAARSAAPSDRPKIAERRRRDRRAGKARANHEPAETRMFPARLRRIRVDGHNPPGLKNQPNLHKFPKNAPRESKAPPWSSTGNQSHCSPGCTKR